MTDTTVDGSRCPIRWDANGELLVTGYDALLEVLRRHDVFSNASQGEVMAIADVPALVTADPPIHTTHRRTIARSFSPRQVAGLAPVIEVRVHDLIDRFVDHKRCDFVDEFAAPLPILLIAEVFGVPAADAELLRRWSDGLFSVVGGSEAELQAAAGVAMEFAAYILQRIQDRRALLAETSGEPPADVLTTLVLALDAEGTVTEQELMMISIQLLSAGHETTTSLLANTVHRLCTNPAQHQKLKDDPGLIENVIEEALRHSAPTQFLWRTAVTDYDLAGTPVPAGSRLRISFAEANRDPSRWDDPEEFRIDRDLASLRQHLAFGHGIHTCPGASLLRLEAKIALTALLERLPGLELDPDLAPVPSTIGFIGGWRRLPIRWR